MAGLLGESHIPGYRTYMRRLMRTHTQAVDNRRTSLGKPLNSPNDPTLGPPH